MASAVISAGAVAGRAYSIGGEFHNGDDVRSACDYFGLCGYSSWYSTNPTYSYLNSSYVLNSDILYFSAHGSQDGIYLPNNLSLHDGYGASGNAVDIRNFSLSNTKLVIYDACLTASNGDGSGINLCTTTRDRGANAVLGWRVTIGANSAFEWQKRVPKPFWRLAIPSRMRSLMPTSSAMQITISKTIRFMETEAK